MSDRDVRHAGADGYHLGCRFVTQQQWPTVRLWGAQLVEPYVPEITSFAIRHHQTLRFYEDTEFGYE